MPDDTHAKDVPRWLKLTITAMAAVLVGPIVGSFLVVFALIAGPFLLATIVEQAGAQGDSEGRPHQRRPGTPRGHVVAIF